MLVLSRKIGERIVIGDNVVVQVLAVRRGQVRLGITAPSTVPIRREELPRNSPGELRQDRAAQHGTSTPLTSEGQSHEPSEEHLAVTS